MAARDHFLHSHTQEQPRQLTACEQALPNTHLVNLVYTSWDFWLQQCREAEELGWWLGLARVTACLVGRASTVAHFI
jgi:hypothetical protein